jgi:Protein of unknown function (DUF732)
MKLGARMMGSLVGLGLVALGLVAAACSSPPSAEQGFLSDVKAAGVTGMGGNHALLATGRLECQELAKGVKFVDLDLYLQRAFQGIQEANAVTVAVKAVQDLCPRYQGEVPSGPVRSTTATT